MRRAEPELARAPQIEVDRGGKRATDTGLRGALRVPAFRRIWTVLSLSSLGDWLGLLATTAMAAQLTKHSTSQASYAVAGVFILRLIPALLCAPLAGVVADWLDRRTTMVLADVGRFALFASIPVVDTLWWLLTATFAAEVFSLFWIPAKEATIPNLVPREQLEAANQLSLVTAYGSAPVAAGLFTALSLLSGTLGARYPFFVRHPAALALWFDAATFALSAATIASLTIPSARDRSAAPQHPLRSLVEGWRFVAVTPLVRGLLVGMLGAFAAGGTVVGLAPTFVRGLHAGNPGYGVLFGALAVFVGLAVGMLLGPRLLGRLSRRRMFALAVSTAGLLLAAIGLTPQFPVVVGFTVQRGGATGVGWVTGYTLLGREVPDAVRGRTFAFVQSAARLTLITVLALAPLLAGAIGSHTVHPTRAVRITYSGAAVVILVAGVLATVVGVVSFRHIDDRRGVSLVRDVVAAVRNLSFDPEPIVRGYFIAFEGGDGAGKSTQVERLADWLRGRGHEVVTTREPGGTLLGKQLRAVLLDVGTGGLSSRTEALLYAADRAEHVAAVIRPALRRGAVVVTDRYVDSSIAYQGAGRALSAAEVERLSRWATQGLRPHLTVLLDVDPEVAARRRAGKPDRHRGGVRRVPRPGPAGLPRSGRARTQALSGARRRRGTRRARRLRRRRGGRTAACAAGRGAAAADVGFRFGAPGGASVTVWTPLVGQARAVATLQAAAIDAAARLASPGVRGADAMTHAWLLTGPPGSGRSTAARAFAAAVQCPSGGCGACRSCQTVAAGTHPDVEVVATELLSIGVKDTRELVRRAALAPVGGRYQVLIYEDADRLTEQAANALLKAIEEPAPRTVWILCAPSAEDVLPTIRSRCRLVHPGHALGPRHRRAAPGRRCAGGVGGICRGRVAGPHRPGPSVGVGTRGTGTPSGGAGQRPRSARRSGLPAHRRRLAGGGQGRGGGRRRGDGRGRTRVAEGGARGRWAARKASHRAPRPP